MDEHLRAGTIPIRRAFRCMQQCKPVNVQARMLRAQWTEGSAHQAMGAWLRRSTSRTSQLDAIVAQDDSMAIGARKAVQEAVDLEHRERWLSVPFTGCEFARSQAPVACPRPSGNAALVKLSWRAEPTPWSILTKS